KEVIKGAKEGKSVVKSIILLIGPEGGFSHEEVDVAVEAGFTPVSLGSHILRTETAPIVALSILQYEFGQMG
ncbi:MAG: RsmE family RNA methyltransferase, partial [Nitrospirota bacterium]